jgi:hypothetical protein
MTQSDQIFCPPTSRKDTLGICLQEAGFLSAASLNTTFQDIARFGFRHVRFEVPWRGVQPTKDTWDWTKVREIRAAATAQGITLLPVLGAMKGLTDFQRHDPTWAWTPTDFGVFAAKVAQELRCPAYEVNNEMNLHAFNPFAKVEPVIEQSKAAYVAIKAVQPDAQLVYPGLAACLADKRTVWWFFTIFENKDPVAFFDESLKKGMGPFFDVASYHPYSTGGATGFVSESPSANQVMLAKTGQIRASLDKADYTQKQLWLTEWGFDMAVMSNEEASKRFAIQLPLMEQHARSYLYTWRDNGNFVYGCVDANNNPREPFYSTVKAALNG